MCTRRTVKEHIMNLTALCAASFARVALTLVYNSAAPCHCSVILFIVVLNLRFVGSCTLWLSTVLSLVLLLQWTIFGDMSLTSIIVARPTLTHIVRVIRSVTITTVAGTI